MHIAYLIDHLGTGGAQRQIVELAVEVAKRDRARITVLVYRNNRFFADRLETAGVHVHLLPKSRTLDVLFPFQLRRWLRANSVDVLHCFLQAPSFWGNIATKMLPRTNRPALVCSERSNQISHTPLFSIWHRFIFRGADTVTVNATPVATEISQKCGVAASRIHYVPNGIDLKTWDIRLSNVCPIELEPEFFHVGLVGRMEHLKNPLLLVHALSHIDHEILSKWRIWLIGCEGWGDDDYRSMVKSEIEKSGLSRTIRYLPPQQEIAAIMRELDLIVLPSIVEGFPNVVMEAMASATPVVATDVGDVPWIIEHEQSGYVVPSGDSIRLSEALMAVYRKTHEEREVMGRRGRELVEENFQICTIAEQYFELYRSLNGIEGPY